MLLLVLVATAFLDSHQFFQAYLVGWTFWTGITVGSLALLMLQHMTGGGWGFVIRRVLEASTRTLPIMALLFLPVILGAHSIYEWTHDEVLKQHPVVAFKTPYLNLPFFTCAQSFISRCGSRSRSSSIAGRSPRTAPPTLVTRNTCAC